MGPAYIMNRLVAWITINILFHGGFLWQEELARLGRELEELGTQEKCL